MAEDASPTSPTDFLSGRPEARDVTPSPQPSERPETPASNHEQGKQPQEQQVEQQAQHGQLVDGKVILAPLPDFNHDPKAWKHRQRIARRFPFLPPILLDIYFRIAAPPVCARYAAEDAGKAYIVLGIFYRGDTIPMERFVVLRYHSLIFWRMSWEIFKLRGFTSLFSLKGVKTFRVYKCNWETGSHEGLELARSEKHKLLLFLFAYQSWRFEHMAGHQWVKWLQASFNDNNTDPTGGSVDTSFSLEVVLGWSAIRITIAVLVPIIFSLVLGLVMQGRHPDSDSIQTAWTVASYVVTAAALLAALLGFATNAAT